jgi:hypothetical protein
MVSHKVLYCADLADNLNTALAADDHFWLDLLNLTGARGHHLALDVLSA